MSNGTFWTKNPATGERLAEYSYFSQSQVEDSLVKAAKSHVEARKKSISQRSQALLSLSEEFQKIAPELAKTMSLEMGKPVSDSMGEIEKSAKACRYFAEKLEEFLKPEEISSNYNQSYVVRDSIGPVLAIMPWNFPLWQVIRFAAPAVGIGNPIVLKHSNLTAGTAIKIQEVFDQVQKGLLYNVPLDHDQVAKVIADKRISAVTLTGSGRAGAEVAAQAGRHLKKSVLELGGSDAYVVFADSDIKRAAEICAKARMTNNGQSCVAAKRFIVERSAMESFTEAFSIALGDLRYGDPMSEQTKTGSLASKKFQQDLFDQCATLEKSGAKKIFDQNADKKFSYSDPGAFFPARIYEVGSNITQVFEEEFFGPVALVTSFKDGDENEALELSNRSVFGLGGALFCKDLDRAQRLARQMDAGFIAINDQVKSDPRLPFGGVKSSGFGRELSRYGFDEFCNIKTIGVNR